MFSANEVLQKSTAGSILIVLFLTYYAESVDHLDDPEPEVSWTPPAQENSFANFKIGANYSGLLYAGVVEFNWIVDMRTQDSDQEFWATGNLISFYHIMTSCRAADFLQKKATRDTKTKTRDPDAPDPKWNVEVYPLGNTEIRINYCENYLWAEGRLSKSDVDRPTTGSRSVRKVIRHPACNAAKIEFDVAMLTMWSAVPAVEPRLGYMPTGFDYVQEKYEEKIKLDPSKPITYQSPLCYVASFGRNYVNHKEFYVLDYKVKYRVYITKWADCRDVWKYICKPDNKACQNKTVPEQGSEFLMCMRPRARVGTVCDHDRGSPVVCNGQVIAMVTRGADYNYCNNLYKIPFVAERINHYKEFFDQSVYYVVKPVPRKEDPIATSVKPGPHADASNLVVWKFLYILTVCISLHSILR